MIFSTSAGLMLAKTPAYVQLIYACMGLLVLITLMGAAIHIFRSRLAKNAPSSPAIGFSLQDLRDMHARGQLTKEELDRAIARVADNARKQAFTPPKPPKAPGKTTL